MSFRESLARSPYLGLGAGVLLLVTGGAVILLQSPTRSAPKNGNQRYYTTDDGKTWFADDATKLPPFEKDGKEAVVAHVFRAGDGGKFVNHLERFRADAKRVLERANQGGADAPGSAAIRAAYTGGREMKRPGDAKWTAIDNPEQAARQFPVRAPGGGAGVVEIEP